MSELDNLLALCEESQEEWGVYTNPHPNNKTAFYFARQAWWSASWGDHQQVEKELAELQKIGNPCAIESAEEALAVAKRVAELRA